MSEAADISPEALARQIARGGLTALRARLLHEPPELPLRPKRGDFDLSPDVRPPPRDLIPAAVLIPIVVRDEPTVLFTQRTETLARHAGQVSFPGGRVEEGDVS